MLLDTLYSAAARLRLKKTRRPKRRRTVKRKLIIGRTWQKRRKPAAYYEKDLHRWFDMGPVVMKFPAKSRDSVAQYFRDCFKIYAEEDLSVVEIYRDGKAGLHSLVDKMDFEYFISELEYSYWEHCALVRRVPALVLNDCLREVAFMRLSSFVPLDVIREHYYCLTLFHLLRRTLRTQYPKALRRLYHWITWWANVAIPYEVFVSRLVKRTKLFLDYCNEVFGTEAALGARLEAFTVLRCAGITLRAVKPIVNKKIKPIRWWTAHQLRWHWGRDRRKSG